jgi:hypothetical protein
VAVLVICLFIALALGQLAIFARLSPIAERVALLDAGRERKTQRAAEPPLSAPMEEEETRPWTKAEAAQIRTEVKAASTATLAGMPAQRLTPTLLSAQAHSAKDAP